MENEMNVLTEEEIKQFVEGYGERKEGGRPIRIRIILATEGLGSFTALSCNTAKGCRSIWISPGSRVPLRAKPASGHKFSYWDYNDNYMSSEPNYTCNPHGAGSTITAHFDPEE
ncbi:MAG: hypothetical protein AEth_00482 [Candidatus Argoarchaeum ethanivorans]|uniref:Bacterial repeat domain-containing protein n=1 Tax=Candidatus Argoarchaeum ethanivorans TaxID=2608793 RepID=A0A8B3S5A1_9EURY|nr:MAG: hypothetical protein AEth_00482 [Candidatus Argoarchaeum ethanivorans]